MIEHNNENSMGFTMIIIYNSHENKDIVSCE